MPASTPTPTPTSGRGAAGQRGPGLRYVPLPRRGSHVFTAADQTGTLNPSRLVLAALLCVAAFAVVAAQCAPLQSLVVSPGEGAGELEWGAYVWSRVRSPTPVPSAGTPEPSAVPVLHLVNPLRGGRGGKKSKRSWIARGRTADGRSEGDRVRSLEGAMKKNLKSRLRWRIKRQFRRRNLRCEIELGGK